MINIGHKIKNVQLRAAAPDAKCQLPHSKQNTQDPTPKRHLTSARRRRKSTAAKTPNAQTRTAAGHIACILSETSWLTRQAHNRTPGRRRIAPAPSTTFATRPGARSKTFLLRRGNKGQRPQRDPRKPGTTISPSTQRAAIYVRHHSHVVGVHTETWRKPLNFEWGFS